VDSSAIQTPIIGLITENVYFGGRLVIPAGTEIHGTAQTDHQRERIASGNNWTLVWQNGMEMQLKAIALDREFENSTNQTPAGIFIPAWPRAIFPFRRRATRRSPRLRSTTRFWLNAPKVIVCGTLVTKLEPFHFAPPERGQTRQEVVPISSLTSSVQP
jgi:hypothetical protein